ncbi:MAG: T9SS type A sorting domain-containing protein [Bacteroidota bacterium]
MSAQAQTVGTCQPGTHQVDLDANNVRARLLNTGTFFHGDTPHRYSVPKQSGVNAAFAASLWFAGVAPGSEVYFAGTTYGPYEFWPGPLDADGNPPNNCADYDRMYSVYDADIRAYERDGTLADDLRDWPHHLGAPVVDGDGIEGNYDLAAGDRPPVYGEQSVWWVMNDAGNTKQWSVTPPIGLELQVQAFSAACAPTSVPDAMLNAEIQTAVEHATYYHIKAIHRGDTALRDTYFGWWTDGDLGDASDDYIGTDTLLQMGYYYNANAYDGGQNRTPATTQGDQVLPYAYGATPPAWGSLLAQPLRLSSGAMQPLYFTKSYDPNALGGTSFFPPSAEEHYNQLRGIHRDGQPITYGGLGYGGRREAQYMYPGDPVRDVFWSEENPGTGQRHEPGDRRLLLSSGPFPFAPGDTLTLTVALPWARGNDRLQSVAQLRRHAVIARGLADDLMQYDIRECPASTALQPEPRAPHPDALNHYVLRQNYPEPFSQRTTIRYEVIDTVPVTLTVYDLLGRRVRTLVDGMQSAGVYDVVFDAGDLPTGLYFYRLEAAGYVSITRRMTLQR